MFDPSLLNAPWAQPLLGLIVTTIASWLGARKKPETDGGIHQNATTHGANSPITQKVDRHTWHITHVAPSPQPAPVRSGATRTSSSDDETGEAIAFVVALIGGIAALTWFTAANWQVLSITMRLLTVAAMFVTALTWWRWPHGVKGAWALRVAITVLGSAVLWAVTVLPYPVGDEPSLTKIQAATAKRDVVQSIVATLRMVGMEGILAYELRLGGLCLLLLFLCRTTARALGAVIADAGAHRPTPNLHLVRFGNRLMGAQSMGVGYFATIAITAAIAVALVHPATVGWILAHAPTRLL